MLDEAIEVITGIIQGIADKDGRLEILPKLYIGIWMHEPTFIKRYSFGLGDTKAKLTRGQYAVLKDILFESAHAEYPGLPPSVCGFEIECPSYSMRYAWQWEKIG